VNKAGDWTFLSLKDTMTRLGHEGRTIDVFKIDCEECTFGPTATAGGFGFAVARSALL
jgi:Methyltransferase domain